MNNICRDTALTLTRRFIHVVPPVRVSIGWSGSGPRAQCPQCDYRLAIPKKFLHMGPPMCPAHQVPMEASGDWDGF